jgi:hypothetical protein
MLLLKQYGEKVLGAIKGLDRIRFRGTLRWLANDRGLEKFLSMSHVLLKDFGRWAQEKTRLVRESCARRAEALGVETIYLRSSGVDKEKLAREIAEKKGITEGSICMLSVVETCMAPGVEGDRASKQLRLVSRPRKCVWIYHYFDDPELGFGHVRLQSWVPFTLYVCLNGRHRLEKQMKAKGMSFVKDGNCFPWVQDVALAQELLDEQLRSDWPQTLKRLALGTWPDLGSIMAPLTFEYYWSADETEWATDVMFRSAGELERLYPCLIRHAMIVSDSPAVMRFFGKRNISSNGRIRGKVPQEIMSDCRRREEGVRVKHWINRNSVKMYNKSGSVLRFETTVNNTRDFRVFRCSDDKASGAPSWQKLRKGVSDLHRRCVVSDQSNERYADAIACARVKESLESVVRGACNRVTRSGRRYRGLNPWNHDDSRLLLFLGKGELGLNGFRNKDLRSWLYPGAKKSSREDLKRLSGRVTRLVRLLRAHGLIAKVSGENRYVLSDKGNTFATALLSASNVDVKTLMEMAA